MRQQLVAGLLAERLEVLHGARVRRHHLEHLPCREVAKRLLRAQDGKGTVEPANVELPVECLHRLNSPRDTNFNILKAGKPCYSANRATPHTIVSRSAALLAEAGLHQLR